MIPARTSKNVRSSLRGSAFRRVSHDGRTRFLREIGTQRRLHQETGAARRVRA